MPFIEQLFFGGDHRRDPSARGVLGTSAGVGADVASEVERLCRGWGDPPPMGLRRPALMSFPLAAIMPAIRGRLYAVIRVGAGDEPLFHAVVLGDALYSVFDRNPYLLARHVTFMDTWRPGTSPARIELEADTHEFPEAMIPGKPDCGFIDEAVVQLILNGRMILPLEQATAESDRALALMITCLPVKLRKEMRFASLAASESNAYTLGAVATPGGVYGGWQRLLLATPSSGITPDVAAYQAALVRDLGAGDLNAIARLSLRHEFGGGREMESLVTSVHESRPSTEARSTLEARPNIEPRRLETPLSAVVTPMGQSDFGRAPAAGERRASTGGQGVRTSSVIGGGQGTMAAMRGAAGGESRSSQGLGNPRRAVSRRPGLVRSLVAVVVLFLAGAVVTLRINGRTLAQSLDWAGIPGMMPSADGDPATTLLEVIDVGRVYEDQRSSLAGAGGGLGPSVDQGRRKALANLTAKGAAPLVAQIDLFVNLSADGIQQGSRPDRETERLRSLATQGTVLGNELKRLELAWYSLASGTLWRDLAAMSDEAVAARSDSLTRRDRAALDEARTGMGLTYKIKDLAEARRSVNGMASLVELFQATAWSPRWAADLKAAADLVSPTASPLTRAYRNCAFQLLRVKEAERSPANRGLPYAGELVAQAWPSPAIRGLLPDLRRAAGAFARDDAPALVAGTLKLYAELGDPARAAGQAATDGQYLARLEANPAFKFDAAAYRPFIDRLRYEATVRRDAGTGSSGKASADAARFRRAVADGRTTPQWRALADSLRTPFLAEWARRQAGAAEVAAGEQRQVRSGQLAATRAATVDLRRAVAEGKDWSADWRRVSALATRFLGEAAASGDGADGTAEVAELAAALERALPLRLEQATIRLPQPALTLPEVAVLELAAPSAANPWRSRAFTVGPSAPAGTGWVGHVDLDWAVLLGARDELSGRVVAADGRVLLRFTAPSLADGGGPGTFGRLRPADGGSVHLKAGAGWWSALEVPAPAVNF
ncbi:MAG: hypothetical protein IPH86_01280 [bacterium]|nr:hypothetical protein [bacterium]